jgi:hypothetical protein
MRHRVQLAVMAGVALLACACGSTSGQHGAGGGGSSPSQCAAHTDTATAEIPRIQMEASGSSTWRTVPKSATPVSSCSLLTVTDNGSVDLRFGTQATCSFGQDPYKPAVAGQLQTREPADAYFNQYAGQSLCTVTHEGKIPLCGMGTLLLDAPPNQVKSTCNKEPDFSVAVLSGAVEVEYQGATQTIEAGKELTLSGQIVDANFTAADVAIFDAQAPELGMEITRAPQAISFTSEPPPSPTPGENYTVTATGGGSPYPVLFSPAPASTKICKIATSTPGRAIVTFTAPGTCVIEASQNGNEQFLPAPPAQQSITVVPGPS